MIVRVRNLRLSVDEDESRLLALAASRLGIEQDDIVDLKIARKAVDARRRKVFFSYAVDVALKKSVRLPRQIFSSPEITVVEPVEEELLTEGDRPLKYPPIIVGAGPCGLFCAYLLARHGYRPVVLERGREIEKRVHDVSRFWETGSLNPESNVQFGEGGAGTFSDGKLTTRIGDKRVDTVLSTLVALGAPEDITYVKHPHVGTDRLRQVVVNLRREIIRLRGSIYFNARLTGIDVREGRVAGVEINGRFHLPASLVVLAVGHSARDVYQMLDKMGISLLPKGFAMGLRVEHPQALIDRIQFGEYAGHPRLGPAAYQITYQDGETGHNVYSFCMCPGGQVIAAASEPGQVVTNGMSYYRRDSGVANSALVATVSPTEWDETSLGGIKLQRELEAKAFQAGGGNYAAPVQRAADFLKHVPTAEVPELATYRPAVRGADLWEVLPDEISQSLERALRHFERKMPGFAGDKAVLTGVETRTSSPVRIERDEGCQSVSLSGLYPAGEGAGYAGGIVSAAVDGLRVAEHIITEYARPEENLTVSGEGIIDASRL